MLYSFYTTIEGNIPPGVWRRLVGEVGLEPTKPLGSGFTAHRNCHYPTRPDGEDFTNQKLQPPRMHSIPIEVSASTRNVNHPPWQHFHNLNTIAVSGAHSAFPVARNGTKRWANCSNYPATAVALAFALRNRTAPSLITFFPRIAFHPIRTQSDGASLS